VADSTVVSVVRAALYAGDDQPFTCVPDASADVSGIPLPNWQVELRLCRGRVELVTESPVSFLTIPMTWDANNNLFYCTITKAQTLSLAPGAWTGDVWRTNPNNSRLLVRVAFTVYPGVRQ
jgi:hypothetical protein